MSDKCDGCELDLAHEKCMAEVSALTAERDALKERVKELEEALKLCRAIITCEGNDGLLDCMECNIHKVPKCLAAKAAQAALAKHEGAKP